MHTSIKKQRTFPKGCLSKGILSQRDPPKESLGPSGRIGTKKSLYSKKKSPHFDKKSSYFERKTAYFNKKTPYFPKGMPFQRNPSDWHKKKSILREKTAHFVEKNAYFEKKTVYSGKKSSRMDPFPKGPRDSFPKESFGLEDPFPKGIPSGRGGLAWGKKKRTHFGT